jgi:hypothetical protein
MRRARAIVNIEGLRELNRRVNKQKTDALNLCETKASHADEATMGLIEQYFCEHEMFIGREEVATSPFRANGPIAKLQVAPAAGVIGANYLPGQLSLFEAGEER